MPGRLVLIDENNGEIVAELDSRLDINEDPSLSIHGRKNDPVIIELPEDDTNLALAHVIPPEDQDWIIKSASFARYCLVALVRNTPDASLQQRYNWHH